MAQNYTHRAAYPSPKAANTPIRLEDFLPYRLTILATEMSHSFARLYGDAFDLAIPEWRVIATLGQFETRTAKEICQHSRMHKTTVSRAVAALEKRKLVALRTNRDDMREVFLSLTEEGRALYFKIVPIAREFEETLCQGLSDDEIALFESVMSRLAKKVQSLPTG